jgi:SAM-dependent methyltransferase
MSIITYTGTDNLELMASLARNYNAFLTSRVEKHCRGLKDVVDFGAGTGTFALSLRDRDYRVRCVEPDDELRRQLQAQGLECFPSLEVLPRESATFIFSLNVLEHIEDDSAALGQVYRSLKPGGFLYLYVPAFNVLFSSMDVKVGHFRRYTKSTLIPPLRRLGFKIRQARYVDSLGFAASLCYKWFGNDRGDLNTTALRLYDRYAFPVSRILDLFVGDFLGKNLEVVAVRPK